MNKHQLATYRTLGIDTSYGTLSDDAVKNIFEQLSHGHLNWDNQHLRESLLSVRRDYPSRRYLVEFMKSVIRPEGIPPTSPEYWRRRGFNEDECAANSSGIQQSRVRVLQPQYWQKKGYTYDESITKIKQEQSRRSNKAYKARDKNYRQTKTPRSIQYWLSRGYSNEDAQKQLEIIAHHHSKSLKGRPCWIPPHRRNTSVIFYEALGLSKTEANMALRKRQTTRTLSPEQQNAFTKYYTECWWYTRQNTHKVPDIELRSSEYHLDHMFSIFDGFTQNIEPRIIGSHVNLRIVSAKENLQKQRNSCITLEDLLYEYTQLEHRNTANL